MARYGGQIADGLAHAQEHTITHRDLKCANVMITPDGRAKILDFGVAVRGQGLSEATRSGATLAEADAIAGTLPYMAPEVLAGAAADARSDIWALGVVLYELASGRRSFGGHTGFEMTSAILRDSPASLPAHIPSGLRSVIQKPGRLAGAGGKHHYPATNLLLRPRVRIDVRHGGDFPFTVGDELPRHCVGNQPEASGFQRGKNQNLTRGKVGSRDAPAPAGSK